MKYDEILFETRIKDYSEYLKGVLRKSRQQVNEQNDAWRIAKLTNPDELHPLEKLLNINIVWLHDT